MACAVVALVCRKKHAGLDLYRLKSDVLDMADSRKIHNSPKMIYPSQERSFRAVSSQI